MSTFISPRKSRGQAGSSWLRKIRSLTQAAAAMAAMSASWASATDFDVTNEAQLNTAITTGVNTASTNTGIYFLNDLTLTGPTTVMDPANNATILLQGTNNGTHSTPTQRTITGNATDRIFEITPDMNNDTTVEIHNLTLVGGVPGGSGNNGLYVNGNNVPFQFFLNSDASFVGNILLDNLPSIDVDNSSDFGAATNDVNITAGTILTVNESTTFLQDFHVGDLSELDFNVTSERIVTFAGDISGDGITLIKQNAGGTVILTGAKSFTNSFLVARSGSLIVNTTANAEASSNPLGIVGGNGIITGSLDSRGTVAPGAAPDTLGTLTLGGTYIPRSGSFLRIDFDGINNDVLAAGSATLNGNGTVFVHDLGGSTIALNRVYTFLQTTGGVTNQFAGAADDMPLVDVVLGYTANTAYFTLVLVGNAFENIAQTPNEMEVANYLDETAPTSTGDYATVVSNLLALNSNQLRSAYNQMSGEGHATASHVTLDVTTLWIQHVANHLRFQSIVGPTGGGQETNLMAQASSATTAATKSQIQQVGYLPDAQLLSKDQMDASLACGGCVNERLWNGWSVGYGLGGNAGSDGNASGYNFGMGGLLAGVDRWLDDSTLVGLFGGYLGAGFTTGTPSANYHDNAGQLGGYFQRRGDVLYVSGIGGAQFDSYTSQRNINFGAIQRRATGNYDGWQGYGYGETGANLKAGNATVQPFAALQYIHLRQNSISETGAGSLNLFSGGIDTDSLRSLVGSRLQYEVKGENLRRFVPELQASWLHEYIDSSSTLNARFGAVGGSGFNVSGLNVGRDWALLGAGLTYVISDNLRLTANYYAQTNDRQTYHVGAGGLSIQW